MSNPRVALGKGIGALCHCPCCSGIKGKRTTLHEWMDKTRSHALGTLPHTPKEKCAQDRTQTARGHNLCPPETCIHVVWDSKWYQEYGSHGKEQDFTTASCLAIGHSDAGGFLKSARPGFHPRSARAGYMNSAVPRIPSARRGLSTSAQDLI